MMASGFFFTFPILLLVLTIPVSAADSDLYTGIRSLNNTEHYLGVNPLLPIISIEDQKSAKNFIVTSDLRSSSITTNKEKYLLQDFQTSTIDTRINPDELVYLGAFRVPMPEGEEYGWAYGGGGLTYYPSGDPLGGADGHPGSLFGMGHDQQNRITEINIPKPIISLQKKTSDLYMAQTIQPFVNLNTGIFTDSGQGAPLRGDVCFLPRQGNQESDKLYFTFAEHLEFDLVSSLAWSNLQLRAPSVQGPWKIGNYSNFCTNDYLLEIPLSWARQNLPDYRLASGRFRDGSLGGSGPSLFALAPWLDGNPPSKNSILKHVRPLILYEKEYEGSSHVMNGYTNADEWSGGAWITAGTKSAIIFVGTKGRGECWYGFSDGTIWPDDPPYPPIPPPPHNERGWWAERFEGVIYFYDPTDITSVVEGVQPTYYPQPYAELNIDQFLYHITGDKQKRHLGAIAYNREQGFIYISEFQGDGDACLIHVWKIQNSLPKTDNIGIFRGKVWYVDYNGNGYWDAGDKSAAFGVGDGRDIPVTGDWNGDGKTNIGVVRGKTWYADYNGNGYWDAGDKSAVFGIGDGKDIPVTGDWNGDGKTNIGVVRGKTWYADFNGNGYWDTGDKSAVFGIGDGKDIPVTGDWNGDGKTNIGAVRGKTWYADFNRNGYWDTGDKSAVFGVGDGKDIPVTGDWNGDGKTNIGVVRGKTWYADFNRNGYWDAGDKSAVFGVGDGKDIPVIGKWHGNSGASVQ